MNDAVCEPDRPMLERAVAPASSSLPLPRMLVVLAHPDDEVLALGGRLERLAESRLLTITDGAPSNGGDARHHGFTTLDAYRTARRRELADALAHAGVPSSAAPVFAGQVADQTASLHLVALAHAVAAEVQAFQPELVLTHPYEGGHPDHDACAFAVHAAVRIAAEGSKEAPILEAPFYHAGLDGAMRTGSFLADEGWRWSAAFELSEKEQPNKRARLACFESQGETLAQFGTAEERFRLAPAYDFTERPHQGQLLYERFPWGMSGDGFCALASAAMEGLFGEGLKPRAGEPVVNCRSC